MEIRFKTKRQRNRNQIKTNLSNLNQELEELKNKSKFPPITEKPEKLEKDIFDAAFKGDLSSVQWFIEKEGVNVDECGFYNQTPLISASKSSQLSIVKYLIEKGADVNAKNIGGWTALHFARTLEVAKCLVDHGADIESVNKYENTPLIWHSETGHDDIVKYFTLSWCKQRS